MNNKRWVHVLLLLFIFMILVVSVINYAVDPFQQYRISDWYQITEKKQRHVTPGLAKNRDYETVVIGSSMAENFKYTQINNELETTSLNLAMAGITAHELSQLLKTVIDNNARLKRVILVLDVYSFSGAPDRYRNDGLPLHLYDDNIFNDFIYLLNEQTLKYSIRMIRKERGKKTDFDKLWYWGDRLEFSKATVMRSMGLNNFNTNFRLPDYKIEVLKKSFEYNILPYINSRPDIDFILLFPPYSYLAYKDMLKKDWLNDMIDFKRYVIKYQSENISVYDFQCLTDITENLDNYKDVTHYSAEISEYLITSIAQKKHLASQNNMTECFGITVQSAMKSIPVAD